MSKELGSGPEKGVKRSTEHDTRLVDLATLDRDLTELS